jgi:hypothetical protein
MSIRKLSSRVETRCRDDGHGTTESASEYHPLGIDLESIPLIIIAAVVSSARPNALPGTDLSSRSDVHDA